MTDDRTSGVTSPLPYILYQLRQRKPMQDAVGYHEISSHVFDETVDSIVELNAAAGEAGGGTRASWPVQ